MITADVYDNAGNYIETLDAGRIISLLHKCRDRYRVLVGSIEEEGVRIGWKFVRCAGKERCTRHEVFNVILEKGAWKYVDNTPYEEQQTLKRIK